MTKTRDAAARAVEQAKTVAKLLDEIGLPKQANDVRRLCRSNQSYRTTLALLHRDNALLRGELREARNGRS